jgi:hypothetical protein
MGITELRTELHNFINQADERFLKMLYAMSREYNSSAVIGYNPDGTPITQSQLVARVQEASQRVKEGNFISQDELEKEIENW